MGIIERFLRGLFGVGILVCLFNEMAWALRDIQSFSADFRQKVRSSEEGMH